MHLNVSLWNQSKNNEDPVIGSKIKQLCFNFKLEDAVILYHQNTKDCVGATALITYYKQLGVLDQCFAIYRSLVRDERPNLAVFGALIHACQSLRQFRKATHLLSEMKFHQVKPSTIIVQMLATSCCEIGDTETAKQLVIILRENKEVLKGITPVTFTQLMKTFGMKGQVGGAMNLLEFMQSTIDHKPNEVTYLTMIKICAEHKNLTMGKLTHNHIKKQQSQINLVMGNALVHMYARCNDFKEAYNIFHSLERRDIISWTSILSNLVLHGKDEEAMKFFEELKKNIKPNWVAYLAVVNATADLKNLTQAKKIHQEIANSRMEQSIEMQTALFTMYAKCGALEEATKIFESIQHKDVICWNRMLKIIHENMTPEDTMKFYERMQKENIKENATTYIILLDMCAQTNNLHYGKQLHETGLQFRSDIPFLVSVLNMYVKCGAMKHARNLFHNLGHLRNHIVWNTMLKAYGEAKPQKTIELFQRMQTQRVKFDVSTVDIVVEATLRKQLAQPEIPE